MGGSLNSPFRAAQEAAEEAKRKEEEAAQAPPPTDQFQPGGKGQQEQPDPMQHWRNQRPQYQARRRMPSNMFGRGRFSGGPTRTASQAMQNTSPNAAFNRSFNPPPPPGGNFRTSENNQFQPPAQQPPQSGGKGSQPPQQAAPPPAFQNPDNPNRLSDEFTQTFANDPRTSSGFNPNWKGPTGGYGSPAGRR